jgi:hypothetical protein
VFFVILNLVNPDFIFIAYHLELTPYSYEMILLLRSACSVLFLKYQDALVISRRTWFRNNGEGCWLMKLGGSFCGTFH